MVLKKNQIGVDIKSNVFNAYFLDYIGSTVKNIHINAGEFLTNRIKYYHSVLGWLCVWLGSSEWNRSVFIDLWWSFQILNPLKLQSF